MTNRPFVDPESLSSFLNTHIPLQERLQTMTSVRHVLGGLGSANRSQTSVDKILQTIAGFGRRLQEGPNNSYQEAVI